jgi:hypothetical protein
MHEETRTAIVFDSLEEMADYWKERGTCFFCFGPAPHDEQGCPTAIASEGE